MLRSRRFAPPFAACSLTVLGLATSAGWASGCSSETASSSPTPPAGPTWEGAPASVPVYDGRTATVPVAIRTTDPSKITVTATSDAVVAEVVPADAQGADGVWRGTLRIRPPECERLAPLF